jgi:protein ImuA
MQPAQRQVLEDLRERIRRIERKPARSGGGVESGWASVDALVPGGFPRGAIAELTGAAGSGKTAVAIRVIARAMGERGLAAWIDSRSELYAPAVQLGGVDLERLLIVRPGGDAPLAPSGAMPPTAQATARQALWAAEAVLGSGAFAAVVVDVPLAAGARAFAEWGPGASVESMLRRLVAAVEKGGATCIWLSERGACVPPARVRLEVWRASCGGIEARAMSRGIAGKVAGHAA